MPFNKGDFTQQGVAGHVNAKLRLNEKRLVNIDMTSNEEAEGCTITGTVKDLLNDKVYAIGAGVSGNIEITENGENINVAPFATATVNVSGGGEIPLLTLTIVNNRNINVDNGSEELTNRYENNKLYPEIYTFEINTTTTLTFIGLDGGEDGVLGYLYSGNGVVSNTVNCTHVLVPGEAPNPDMNYIMITDSSQPSSATITFPEPVI